MQNDHFFNKAHEYEKDIKRVENVLNIANSMKRNIIFDKSMHIMDFGSGTGLLLEQIAPLVNKITAIDISEAMNSELVLKKNDLKCTLEILQVDLTKTMIDLKFDGIISSMAIHHVKDILSLFCKFYELLNDGGFVAIADLDKEDGNFHTEDTGVYHFGFDHQELISEVEKAGFSDIKMVPASISYKPHGAFPVFLLHAYKKS